MPRPCFLIVKSVYLMVYIISCVSIVSHNEFLTLVCKTTSDMRGWVAKILDTAINELWWSWHTSVPISSGDHVMFKHLLWILWNYRESSLWPLWRRWHTIILSRNCSSIAAASVRHQPWDTLWDYDLDSWILTARLVKLFWTTYKICWTAKE